MKFKLDKVIFGNDLDSIAYSFLTGIPIVCENLQYPQSFEFFKPEHHLDLLKITNESNQMRTPDGVLLLNDTKQNVFKKLLFFLSLLGKIKFANDIKFVSLSEPNVLKICTQTNRIHEIEFDELIIPNNTILKDADYEIVEHLNSRVIERFHVGKALGIRAEIYQKQENYESYLFQRKAILANLMEKRIKFAMPGNFQLTSGLNVNVMLPNMAQREKGDDNIDESLSGKYLIVATRQIIGLEKHETVIEVATTSTQKEYVATSDASQTFDILNY